jgi:agmatine/peptidylarginine deiminase
VRSVGSVVGRHADARGRFDPAVVEAFATVPADAPVFNFQCFLAACDLLASTGLSQTNAALDAATRRYLMALHDLEGAMQAQRARLRSLGWKVTPVPSMPDLKHSLNYLNGLQDRTRYLMPAIGGFYGPVDQAAAETFHRALGDPVAVVPIHCARLQQQHGALHCVASAYPRFPVN